MKGILELHIAGEDLLLLPQKAIYWPSRQALLLADTHIGKITHFRKAGIALPDGAAIENLAKLQALLEKWSPKEVFFLGDLFHSELNTEWFGLKALLQRFCNTAFHLIQGNHDILDPLSYQNLNFRVHLQPLPLNKLLLSHEPMEEVAEGYINFCGHIHPGVRLMGEARQRLRFPCFYQSAQQLILPAFGEFTGLQVLTPKKGERVFVCASTEVLAF